MLLIATSMAFSWVIAYERIPDGVKYNRPSHAPDYDPFRHYGVTEDEGQVKLIDFCLAFQRNWKSVLCRRLLPRTIPGSPSYMAPEVIRGQVPGYAADLYSLGVITYFALTGRLPFSADSPAEILRLHERAMPTAPTQLNDKIPRSLEKLVFLLLAALTLFH